jgi:hypothetical protein
VSAEGAADKGEGEATGAGVEARPAFTGMAIYRDLRLRFSFLVEESWQRQDLPKEQGGGVVYVPDPTDPDTMLIVQGKRLPLKKVQADDLEPLQAGFLDGINQLSESHIEEGTLKAQVTRDLLDLAARHTFRDAASGQVRKRWVRVLYRGNVQISVIGQGSSPEAFEKWLPMFSAPFNSVQFADWWAEVTGHQWMRSLEQRPVEAERVTEAEARAEEVKREAAKRKRPARAARRKPS